MSISVLETVTDYLSDARILLQDTIAPYRYDDASLITGLNLALAEGRRIRADLFVYTSDDLPFYNTTNVGEEVPIEEQFRQAFLHGMVAHAIERDQEDIQDARAAKFFDVYNRILLGVGPPAAPQG